MNTRHLASMCARTAAIVVVLLANGVASPKPRGSAAPKPGEAGRARQSAAQTTPAGPTRGEGGRPASKTAQSASTPWTPSRTPWGDPDLQGIFTNSNEYATPLERPDRL